MATTKTATKTTNTSIYQALVKAQAAIKNVGKNGKNKFDNYAYRGIDDVMDAVHAAFVEAGVVAVPKVLNKEQVERTSRKGDTMIHTTLEVEYTFYATDGTSISAIVQGEGMDRGDKSINKAMSGAYKYAMFQVLAIPTAEMIDSETESPEIQAGKKQAKPAEKKPGPETEEEIQRKSELLAQVIELADIAGITMKQLAEINHGQAISELPVARLEKCVKWLDGKAREAAAKREQAEAEAQALQEEATDGELTELEALQDKVVDLAEQAGVSLEDLEEQAGQPLVACDETALTAVIGYLNQIKERGEAKA